MKIALKDINKLWTSNGFMGPVPPLHIFIKFDCVPYQKLLLNIVLFGLQCSWGGRAGLTLFPFRATRRLHIIAS